MARDNPKVKMTFTENSKWLACGLPFAVPGYPLLVHVHHRSTKIGFLNRHLVFHEFFDKIP